MIVVDASVVVTALADDGPDGDLARERLRGERLAAPHLIDLEATSAWLRMVAAGDLDARRAELAITDLLNLRLDRVPHGPLVPRCWELRASLTVHDAAYIALAEALESTLVTAQGGLATAPGSRCTIEVLSSVPECACVVSDSTK
ncbi:MAG: type II toxin-antitoxin system VapC family toxin [Acidimicrobiales bacterium]